MLLFVSSHPIVWVHKKDSWFELRLQPQTCTYHVHENMWNMLSSIVRFFEMLQDLKYHSFRQRPKYYGFRVAHTSVPGITMHFSRMRSEGFSFYIWGSGGWPVFAWPCFWRPQPSATVRNRLQPFATVRLRPSWAQSCRAYRKSCTNVSFSTCQKMCACRFAWQAWHLVTFTCVRCKIVLRLKSPCL